MNQIDKSSPPTPTRTDTAGSGRVPAAFNNIAGLKPTRGRVSLTGVVPACRSLDCIAIFALSCADAHYVLKYAQEEEPKRDIKKEDLDITSHCPVPFRFVLLS